VRRALLLSRLLHALMILLLVAVGQILAVGAIFYLGVALTALLLAYEHSLVSERDLSRVNRAFFTVNGCISFLLFAATLGDQLGAR
jgi:4-hydroxybenzoate polyprenyltransferase